MNPFFILLISGLAVFRLSECVAVDNGPFHVFKAIREACKKRPVLCELVTCQYCQGGWWSMACAWYIWWATLYPSLHPVFWWAGIWGAQAAIMRTVRERAP
jgi:hypothetical protein